MSATLTSSAEAALTPAVLDARSLHGTRGWAVAVRLAWRDSWAHRGRTALAMLMIGLPVLLASAVATVNETNSLDGRERVQASLGSADIAADYQGSDTNADVAAQERAAVAGVRTVLGQVPTATISTGQVQAASGKQVVLAQLTVTDTSSPLTAGLFDVFDGRLPAAASEVAIAPGLLRHLGIRIGDTVTVAGQERTVTGTAVRRYQSRIANSLISARDDQVLFDRQQYVSTTVLARTDQALTWTVFDAFQRLSFYAVSGDGAAGTPTPGAGSVTVAQVMSYGDVAVVGASALTLVIIQLTLLAGPAFAVGIRQQRRTLAQLVASGADRRSLRRVVITQAGLVGAASAGVGASLGVGLALAFMALARDRWPGGMGPLDVPWPAVLGAVAIGTVAALLAALAPAVTVARQSVAGALAMSRGQLGYPWRRAVAGTLIFVASSAWLSFLTAASTRVEPTNTVTGVSVGLVTLTVGLLLVIPLAVAMLLPLGRPLPPVWRLAMRDAARTSTRSVAAVAAVAAATGGLVAVSTYYASIGAFARDSYVPSYAPGVALVSADPMLGIDSAAEAVAATLPAAPVSRFGVVEDKGGYIAQDPSCPVSNDGCNESTYISTIAIASHVPVVPFAAGDAGDPPSIDDLLGEGVLVVSRPDMGRSGVWAGGPATLVRQSFPEADTASTLTAIAQLRVVIVPQAFASGTEAVMSPAAAAAAGITATDERLLVGDGSLTHAELRRLRAAVEPGGAASVQAELGYNERRSPIYIVLVLAALFAVVAGTLAATALTLADSRPERAMVAAVGAGPLTARLSAGATAVVIAALGGLAGTVLGLVPGILGARSQTDWLNTATPGDAARVVDPTVVIPWLVILGVVVVVPLLLGLFVALVTRGPSAIEGARSRPGGMLST